MKDLSKLHLTSFHLFHSIELRNKTNFINNQNPLEYFYSGRSSQSSFPDCSLFSFLYLFTVVFLQNSLSVFIFWSFPRETIQLTNNIFFRDCHLLLTLTETFAENRFLFMFQNIFTAFKVSNEEHSMISMPSI